MQVDIYAKKFKLTDAIKKNIENSIETLDKYSLKIISVSTTVWVQDNSTKKVYGIELLIKLPHKNTVIIKHTDKDIYVAISMAIDRAKRVLRKHHNKIVDRKTSRSSQVELNLESNGGDAKKTQEYYEVIDVEQQHTKPTYVEDAIVALKNSSDIFLVFTDTKGDRRVIYKKADNKFGIF